jgi:UDP-N-acetylglucosamine 2-epimerase (non-hydrolysing)
VSVELVLVAGARPNFVKAAALLHAFARQERLRVLLVHTGQHYDAAMSDVFLQQLGIPAPDVHLGVGSGSHGVQTGRLMMRLERFLAGRSLDRLLVVGDVNSTMAAALVGAKLGIPVDHVEAGLRSGDRRMPEEINRIVVDSVASRFWVSEPAGVENLLREGHDAGRIHHVGNVMIDTLVRLLAVARARSLWTEMGLAPRTYAVVTLHRPSNVDDPARLGEIIACLQRVSRRMPVLFPVHPRTRSELRSIPTDGLRLEPPLGYLEFLSLMSESTCVITDSGGIQEETTYLGIPCLTLRETTERPVTVAEGTNTLVGGDLALLEEKVVEVAEGRYRRGRVPELWDGEAAVRIAEKM